MNTFSAGSKFKAFAVGAAFLLVYGGPFLLRKAGADQSGMQGGQIASLPVVPAAVSAAPVVQTATPASQIPLHLRISAYSSTPDQTDDTPFITADGSYVHDGIVATNLLPFGTQIRIPALFGDKVFTVEDRMNPKFQRSIDIWMKNTSKAIYFGVHYADVVVVSNTQEAAAAITAAHSISASDKSEI